MAITRRQVLQSAALAGTVLGFRTESASASSRAGSRGKQLDLLILGGTRFLGPHLVEGALERGHTVTLFNRGRSNTHLFPELEKLVGDRDPDEGDGLGALEGRRFDAVIDTSSYFPRHTQASAELLAEQVSHYVLISTISVYAAFAEAGMDETAELGKLEDETVEEVTGATYGPLKALCEQAAEAAMPGRVANIRPGLIVGPRDETGRFTYWPARVRRGGEVLAPGSPDDPVQYIDARDLAAFALDCAERGTAGVFNATGPNAPTNVAELLYGCKAVSGGDASFTWVDADFLESQGIAPWSDMPVWIPSSGETAGLGRVSIARAVAAGLRSRPLALTVADSLAWLDAQPQERRSRLIGGLAPEREAKALAAWRTR